MVLSAWATVCHIPLRFGGGIRTVAQGERQDPFGRVPRLPVAIEYFYTDVADRRGRFVRDICVRIIYLY
jgi:hypothetical protein